MKICMLSRAYPPRIGGTGSLAEKVSETLVEKGFEVSVVTQRIKGAKNFEEKNGVRIFRTLNVSDAQEFSFFNLGIGALAFTKQILQQKDADLFHAHDISVAGFSGCLAKQFKKKKPFLLKYGGDLVFEYLSLKKMPGWEPKKGLEETFNWNKGFAGWLDKTQNWLFSSYDLILPDSYYGKDFLLKKGLQKNKISVLLNGVDLNEFKPMDAVECRKNICLNDNDRFILCASRLVEWKGVDVLIKAFSSMVEKEKNIKLIIGGNGPEEQKLKDLVRKLNLDSKVLFAGNIPRQAMPLYLNASEIFVLPSYFDTTPNALLEAMACGKAIIASDIGGVKEVCQETSLLVEPGNEIALADKISSLLNDASKRNSLGKRALKKAEKDFSLGKTVHNLINIYQKCL